MMNHETKTAAANYFLEDDLKRRGCSAFNFLNASFNKGMASFSISSVLSTVRLLKGRLRSSNTRRLLLFIRSFFIFLFLRVQKFFARDFARVLLPLLQFFFRIYFKWISRILFHREWLKSNSFIRPNITNSTTKRSSYFRQYLQNSLMTSVLDAARAYSERIISPSRSKTYVIGMDLLQKPTAQYMGKLSDGAVISSNCVSGSLITSSSHLVERTPSACKSGSSNRWWWKVNSKFIPQLLKNQPDVLADSKGSIDHAEISIHKSFSIPGAMIGASTELLKLFIILFKN